MIDFFGAAGFSIQSQGYTAMKKCAYCGRENHDDATHCRECGTIDCGVSAPQSTPQPMAASEPEAVDPDPDMAPGEEFMLCPSCLFPNGSEAIWCKRCGAPIGQTNSIVPTDAAQSVGFVFRGALTPRPKLVVVLGVWALFFPGFIYNFASLWILLLGGTATTRGLAGIWLSLAGGAFCSAMLYPVSRNYWRALKRQPESRSEDSSARLDT